MTRRIFVLVGTAAGFVVGLIVALAFLDDPGDVRSESTAAGSEIVAVAPTAEAQPPAPTPTSPPSSPTPTPEPPQPSPTATAPPTAEPTPAAEVEVRFLPAADAPTGEVARAMADSLSSQIQLPSDCGLPLGEPQSLPNAGREYRSGVHAGIDFICLEFGRTARAALPGRVVFRVDGYVDPTPADRSALLATAGLVGTTPPWTLAMLYGNFVVMDHGVVDGVGHVVSIYAHLDEIDDAVHLGADLAAGDPIGLIGNHGTAPAASGLDDPRSIHLHWELYVDGVYLGAGLGTAETATLYEALFAGSL